MNFQISAGSDAQIGAVGSTCIQIIDDDEGINKALFNSVINNYLLYTYRGQGVF